MRIDSANIKPNTVGRLRSSIRERLSENFHINRIMWFVDVIYGEREYDSVQTPLLEF